MNRKIEGLINGFAELTPERHQAQLEQFTTLYEREGFHATDRQAQLEMAKTAAASIVGIVLNAGGIETTITEFQKGNVTGAVGGLLAIAVGLKMIQTSLRTVDNLDIIFQIWDEKHSIAQKS